MNDKIMTMKEVAAELHVTRASAYRWVRDGHLAVFKLPGGDYRVTREEFRAFVERCRVKSSTDPIIACVDGENDFTSIGPRLTLAERNPYSRGSYSVVPLNDGETDG